jgi:hypothetical protein
VSDYGYLGRSDQAPENPGKRLYSGYKGSGEPDGAWWLAQIRKGVEYRKRCCFEGEWETWRKYYRGEYEKGYLPVNVFFKMVRTLVPRVYFRNPSVSVTPSKPGDDQYVLAQILERIDNKLLIRMKVKQAIKEMVQNAFMFGTGIGKLGYGAEFTPTPDFLDNVAPDSKGRMDHRVEFNDLVQPNMPWFLSVHTGSFIVPVGSTDIHSARWVAHWVKRHVDDVKEDPRLRHTADINMSTSYSSEIMRSQERPREEGLVDLVEIRDKKSGKVFIMAPYHNQKILYCDYDEMQSKGHFPFFPLIFNNDDTFFWGLPDAKILEPQQRELNETRTIMMKHRRASIVKLLFEAGALEADEAEKITNETVAAAIRVNDGGLNKIKLIEAANIPQGLITMDALVERDVQEILGLGANQFGEYAPGSADRSATEASIVNQATQIRMDERRDAVADMLVDIITQTHEVIFDRWTGEQVLDIVGPGGVQIWVRFQAEELRTGGYNVTVDPDSTLPETKQVREAKAAQVYQLLRQNPLVDPHKLTSYLLRNFHGPDFDDMMVSPQEAEQQKMQAMQAMAGGMAPGMSPSTPMTSRQAAGIMPGLRQIQGGRGGPPPTAARG